MLAREKVHSVLKCIEDKNNPIKKGLGSFLAPRGNFTNEIKSDQNICILYTALTLLRPCQDVKTTFHSFLSVPNIIQHCNMYCNVYCIDHKIFYSAFSALAL